MSENKKPDTFYDHFSKDKPTGIGLWLTESFSKKVFQLNKNKLIFIKIYMFLFGFTYIEFSKFS